LTGYALFLPSVTSELNAWMGRVALSAEGDESRRGQVVFLILCYSGPMILGLVVRVVHLVAQKLIHLLSQPAEDDAEFRME
jgi:hypothetical protein